MSKTESQISYGNRISQFGFTDMFGLGKAQQPTAAAKAEKPRPKQQQPPP